MKRHLLRSTAAAGLALLMAISLIPARSQAASSLLKQEGTVPDDKGDLNFTSDYIFVKSGDEMKLTDEKGKEIKDASGLKISSKEGYYILTKKGNPVSQSSLVSREGKVVIPYGPAVIDRLNERFWSVSYAIKETKNKDEAMIYSTDNSFSITPSDEDTLYTGKMNVYDVITGKEVPGVEITSPKARISALGDSLLVKDEKGNAKIYDKDGKVLEEDASKFNITGGFFTASVNGTTVVYDSSLKRLFETNFYVSGVGESDEYLYYKDDDQKAILMDKAGKQLIKSKKDGYFGETSLRSDTDKLEDKDILVFSDTSKDDTTEGLIKSDGTELSKSIYTAIYYLGNGYFDGSRRESSETVHDVMDSKGKILGEKLENFSASDMIAYKEGKESGTKKYYVYDKKDYKLELKGANSIAFGLLKVYDDKSGKYGLYDVISGDQVLDYEYANIQSAYGKIYAYKDGAYNVYSINR